MTIQEIEQMLDETEIPHRYHHFEEAGAIEPPFITYVLPEWSYVAADGKTYIKIMKLDLELYTDSKDEAIEERVELVLDDRSIRYQKSESWIESENMYEVLYEMEV